MIFGHHFFSDSKTPFFILSNYGEIFCTLNFSHPAPNTAPGAATETSAVPWLKLDVKSSTILAASMSAVEEVYRIHTVGGSAPETCESMPKTFEIAYAAEYLFYSRPRALPE